MINFVLLNLIVGTSSFLIIFKLLRLMNFIDSLIAWFIAYFAQIIFSQMFLGVFGRLYLWNVLILNCLILLITIVATKKKAVSCGFNGVLERLRPLLENKTVVLVVSLVSGFIMIKLFFNLINPPFGWDSLNYHYTFPVEWIKSAALNNPLVVSDDPFPSYYPINGSLFFLWLILPFKSAFLADLGQFPFFIISFLGVFSICRKFGLVKEYSFFAAALFVIIPNFFKQLQSGYVDIMVGGLFLAAINFLINLKADFNIKNAVIFALTTGIFIGIKTTCLPYAAFLVLPFLCLLFWNKKYTFLKKTICLFLFIFFTSLFGGFSFLRNFGLAGNPFYPLEVTVLGNPVFKGVIDKATFIARREEGGDSLSKLLFHEGLGIQSLLIILPATIAAFFINIIKNKSNIFKNYLMLVPFLLYLTYRYILPLPNSRYLYPMLAVGICIGFYAFSLLRVPFKAVRIIAVIFILASVFDCARRIELGLSFAAALLIFVSLRSDGKFLFSKKVVLAAIPIFILLMQLLFIYYQKNEYARYIKNSRYWPDATKAWAWLNENTKGDNIAYVGRPLPYPLYGTSFKNNVYYVSVNSIDPVFLHSLKNSKYRWNTAEDMHKSFEEPYNYRGNADCSVWLSNLKKRNTALLFIYSLHHTKETIFPLEEKWAKNNPENFRPVFTNNSIRIYRLYL